MIDTCVERVMILWKGGLGKGAWIKRELFFVFSSQPGTAGGVFSVPAPPRLWWWWW